MDNEILGFTKRVDALQPGSRVALKRNAGIMLAEADGKAIAAFYRCNPPAEKQDDLYFAVACLKCLWDKQTDSGTPVEQILAGLDLSESMTHRVEGILDTPWDRDGFLLIKIARLVKMLKQKGTEIPDFAALLEDLIYWNKDNQSVQRKWARAIFINQKGE